MNHMHKMYNISANGKVYLQKKKIETKKKRQESQKQNMRTDKSEILKALRKDGSSTSTSLGLSHFWAVKKTVGKSTKGLISHISGISNEHRWCSI